MHSLICYDLATAVELFGSSRGMSFLYLWIFG